MKQKEINSLSTEEVGRKMTDLSEQLMKMKLTHKVSPMENPLQIRHTRRTIARLNTELAKRNTKG
jgi:large subunit ribosomal protein L29